MIRRPIPILLLVIALVAACGASQREKTLRASVLAVNVARDTLLAFDHKHKREILAKHPAHARDAYDAELAAYKERREPVLEALVAAYRAIGVAAVVNDDQASLDAALAAVAKLRSALSNLMQAATP